MTDVAHPNATELAIYRIRWLADTPIYQDAFEIVAEKARRLWWGQQIDLALVPWSVLLAIEGMRRKIPNLFAFLCLAHLVNLSFAQNLFYVALLLTPTPLPAVETPPTRYMRSRIALVNVIPFADFTHVQMGSRPRHDFASQTPELVSKAGPLPAVYHA